MDGFELFDLCDLLEFVSSSFSERARSMRKSSYQNFGKEASYEKKQITE